MRVVTIAVAVSMIAGASAFGKFHMHLTMVRFQSGSLTVPSSTHFAFNRVHGDDFQLRRRALRLPVHRDGSHLLTNWHYSRLLTIFSEVPKNIILLVDSFLEENALFLILPFLLPSFIHPLVHIMLCLI
jgi:hypothetical protein